SNSKFTFCKVSYVHVRTWKKVLESTGADLAGPILCLGTRNGREVDLFRTVFRQGPILNGMVALNEKEMNGWNPRLPIMESIGRSSLASQDRSQVLGIEINPNAKRGDTHIGSFDEMPPEWAGKFKIIYSNSFDQSQSPYKTAAEWKRVLAPGAFGIFGFSPDTPPTESDPVGRLTYSDFVDLFKGELVYFHKYGSQYQDVILHFP